jgi:hypothetical protein
VAIDFNLMLVARPIARTMGGRLTALPMDDA